MTERKTTHVTVRFTVHDDDVMAQYEVYTGDTEPLKDSCEALSLLIQDVLYDNENGPMIEGEYIITGIEEGTKP